MARIRMVKPEFFDDPQVGELSPLARLFFIGLWTQADREGRLIDDPRRLKARIFPFDDVDVNALAHELHEKDMIRRYITRLAPELPGEPCKDMSCIWIRKFTAHQHPHPKETASVIPPCENGAGKLHGKPGKAGASPSESGSFILDPLAEAGVRNPGRPANGKKSAAAPTKINGRSNHPIFQGQRFVVFDWMLEDMTRMLGSHTDAFDLHGWMDALDRKAVKDGAVMPRTEQWAWLQTELVAEVHRRKLPLASPTVLAHVSKQTKQLAAASAAFLEANK